jgi:soluble lytic murein transglycosylase-like protein
VARRRSSKRRKKSSGAPRPWIALVLAAVLLLIFARIVPTRPLQRWWSEHQGMTRVESHAPLIQAAARESGLDPNLLAGVMMVESRGNVAAESPAGALGLFQLMLPTAAEHAELMGLRPPSKTALLSDAALNTRLGAHYLAWLFPRFEGDEERVLIAYNAGPGRLKRWTEEAGSYAAWRDARDAAGNSDVLAYARNVQHYRQEFADRGVIVPTAAGALEMPSKDAAPSGAEQKPPPAPGSIDPPASTSQQ